MEYGNDEMRVLQRLWNALHLPQGRKILFTVLDVRTCDPGGQEFTTRTDTLA